MIVVDAVRILGFTRTGQPLEVFILFFFNISCIIT